MSIERTWREMESDHNSGIVMDNQGMQGGYGMRAGTFQRAGPLPQATFPCDEKYSEGYRGRRSDSPGYSRGFERPWKPDMRDAGNVEDPCNPTVVYTAHRKDPRLTSKQTDAVRREDPEPRFAASRNDPRLKQMDVPGRADPRLAAKQVTGSEPVRREDYEPRFGPSRKDPRLAQANNESAAQQQQQQQSQPPPAQSQAPRSSMFDKPSDSQHGDLSSDAESRRGPRSPSPRPPGVDTPASPTRKSPATKKRERESFRWEQRSSSPTESPRGRPRDRSPSPKRRDQERGQERRRGQERETSESPPPPPPPPSRARNSPPLSRGWNRVDRSERSPSSPRRSRGKRSRSGSPPPPPPQRRERSGSPRHSLSPSRRDLSSSRDVWRMSPAMNRENSNRQSGDVHSAPPSYGMQYDMSAPPPSSSSMYTEDYNAPPPSGWQENNMVYPDMSQPPPVNIPSGPPPTVNLRSSQGSSQQSASSQSAAADAQKAEEEKKEAVQKELIQQKQTLAKQREEYVKKSIAITRELNLLKDQEEELLREDSRDSKASRILKENNKLQLEIQNKLKAINNVIDMLTGIIGDQKDLVFKAVQKEDIKPLKKRVKSPPESPVHSGSESDSDSDSSQERNTRSNGGTSSDVKKEGRQGSSAGDRGVYNYVYYDPEMHWCRVCNVFPRTAKEFLNHLHSGEHKKETLDRKLVDMPWHNRQSEEETPHYKNAPNRRTPIRGLQFFISVTAWYCKLCNAWIGDLHCASLHLKSKAHGDNYAKFTEQNPHWEADWMAERERAYEHRPEDRCRLNDESMTDELPLTINQKEDKSSHKEREKERKKSKRSDDKKKKKRRKKKSKSRKNRDSSDSSSSTSSSSSSSSSSSEEEEEEEDTSLPPGFDKTKSIRIAMRTKEKLSMMQQTVQNMAAGGSTMSRAMAHPGLLLKSKWESPDEDVATQQAKEAAREAFAREVAIKEAITKGIVMKEEDDVKKIAKSSADDKLLKEWTAPPREVVTEGEKLLLNNIKERVKLKQEAERERDKDKDKEKEREKEREGRERDRDRMERSERNERMERSERERDRDRDRDRYQHHGYYEDRRRRSRRSESPPGGVYRDYMRGRRSGRAGRSPGDRRWVRYERHDRRDSSDRDRYYDRRRSPKREDSRSREERKGEKEKSPVPPPPPPPPHRKDPDSKRDSDDYDEENAESKFEKQTAESAAKIMKRGAKVPVMTLKTKLPFIGRMPILKKLAKKKVDTGDEKGDEKGDQDDPMKDQDDSQNDLLMQVKTQEDKDDEKEEEEMHDTDRRILEDDQVPGGPFDDDEDDMPVGPTVNAEVQDMEIDEEDETSNPEPPAPIAEQAPQTYEQPEPPAAAASPKKPSDIPLPKDFQDALNILFPSQTEGEEDGENGDKEGSPSKLAQAQGMWGPPGMGPTMQQMMAGPPPHAMGAYGAGQMMTPPGAPPMPPGTMPPGMHPSMMGAAPPQGMYSAVQAGTMRMTAPPPYGTMPPPMYGAPPPMQPQPPLPPPPGTPTAGTEAQQESPPKRSESSGQMTQEDLAMLGIDAEDMAAQSF